MASPGRHALVLASLWLGACAVDARHLSPRAGGSGGTGARLVGDSGATGDGDGGAGPDTRGLVDGCADLDTDGKPDCQTTLVENSSFASDVDGWAPFGGEVSWDEANALGDLPSGSAKLVSDADRASVAQCVSLDGYELVIAYANALVEPADGESENQAELEVSFFDTDDCSGVSNWYFDTPASEVSGDWTMVQAGGLSKDTTRSMSIALVGMKAADASALTVYFDNVMLEAKDPE